jgi:hypothetical protein
MGSTQLPIRQPVISRRSVYPVRNEAPLIYPVHHAVQGSAAGFGPKIIPGFDAPLGFESQRLEFLTGFTFE